MDVGGDGLTGLLPGGVWICSLFVLERGKEALGYRVVPAIATPAHALNHAVGLQELTKLVTPVLPATIRMEDQAGRL